MSDYIKDNFLPEDHKEAEAQRNCFYYSNNLSEQAFKQNRIDIAMGHHENASRSLKRLAELKDKHDRAMFRLKQIEADRTVSEQLVSVYARQT